MKIERIRKAVTAHRGGLEEATDDQIRIIWDSLDAATQKQYLDNIKEGKKEDAPGDSSKQKIRNRP